MLFTACQPIDYTVNDTGTDDVIRVTNFYWSTDGNVKPYLFTTKHGHIACSMNEVTFFTDDTINDESQMGLPLNKLAQLRQAESDIKVTVSNAIKVNADLSEAIRRGLDRCKETSLRLKKYKADLGI